MREEGRERKIRSDKKRQIKPTIPIELYDCISVVSYITRTPMKNIGEFVVMESLQNKEVVEHLSRHQRRTYWHSGTMFLGDESLQPYRLPPSGSGKRRTTITFSQGFADELTKYAFTLDTSLATATSLLLETGMKHKDIVNKYFHNNIDYTLDSNKKQKLKSVYKYVVKNSPFNEHVSILEIIKMLLDDLFGK